VLAVFGSRNRAVRLVHVLLRHVLHLSTDHVQFGPLQRATRERSRLDGSMGLQVLGGALRMFHG
jgi:hypothetical protein